MAHITLESRLRQYAEQDREQYSLLWSNWEQNRKRCEELLSNVQDKFIYYSSHSAKHSQRVIGNIEKLLGPKRIKLLSATDLWLLLHAAYMHDIGMVISFREYQEAWSSEEFGAYLKRSAKSRNEDLRNAAHFLLERLKTKHGKPEQEVPQDYPVRVRAASAVLISEYFRPQHADRIAYYLNLPNERPAPAELSGAPLTFDTLNNNRIVRLIEKVSRLHTRDFSELKDLEQTEDGFGRDQIHPRFAAELLRLGDGLDLDAGRFSVYFTFLHGAAPPYSETHRKLNYAVNEFLVSPEKVHYSVNCPDWDTYRLADQQTAYLREEFDRYNQHWDEIVPKDFPKPAPKFEFESEKDLLINGKPDKDGLSKLRFTLVESKAFQLLEGANIYSDSLTFVRELLQNAMDATKIQLWRELQTRYYKNKNILGGVSPEQAQPYDIPPHIYEDFRIEIRIEDKTDGEAEISFTDYGTGFTVDDVKRMCEVTESYSHPERIGEIEAMPLWLRPTGGFGIGLQSVFSRTDQISIDTQSDKENRHLHITIDAPKRGGMVQVDELPDRRDGPGSTISFRVKSNAKPVFDPKIFQTVVMTCAEELYQGVKAFFVTKCRCPFFTVTACYNNEVCSPDGPDIHTIFLEGKEKGRYYYYLHPDGTEMDIWDRETASLVHWELAHAITETYYRFKGMKVESSVPVEIRKGFGELIAGTLDSYGMNAVKVIKLSRDFLTTVGEKNFERILTDTRQFYLDTLTSVVRSALQQNPDTPGLLIKDKISPTTVIRDPNEAGNSFRFSFWLATSIEMRRELSKNYSNWFACDSTNLRCWSISKREILFGKISVDEYVQLYDSSALFSNRYLSASMPEIPDSLLNDRLLNGGQRNLVPYFNYFNIDELPEMKLQAKKIYKLDDRIYITIPVHEEGDIFLFADEGTRNHILYCLNYYRTFFPVFPEYRKLALAKKDIPDSIQAVDCGFYFNDEIAVISPVTMADFSPSETRGKFVDRLSRSEPFRRLVDFVAEHSTITDDKARIEALYLQLAGEIWDARHHE